MFKQCLRGISVRGKRVCCKFVVHASSDLRSPGSDLQVFAFVPPPPLQYLLKKGVDAFSVRSPFRSRRRGYNLRVEAPPPVQEPKSPKGDKAEISFSPLMRKGPNPHLQVSSGLTEVSKLKFPKPERTNLRSKQSATRSQVTLNASAVETVP